MRPRVKASGDDAVWIYATGKGGAKPSKRAARLAREHSPDWLRGTGPQQIGSRNRVIISKKSVNTLVRRGTRIGRAVRAALGR